MEGEGIDFVVVVRADPPYGSPLGAAIFQNYGEQYVKAILDVALSRTTICQQLEVRSVTEVKEG